MALSYLSPLALAALLPHAIIATPGMSPTPPMGWRSWNLYGASVDQSLIQGIMDGMVSRNRDVDGIPTSLCDLGYCDVGLDDNWQICDSTGHNYHDDSGNPVVNLDRFPDLRAMTDYAHSLGLTAGWYGNNCICKDRKSFGRKFYEGDVKAFVDFNFDGWKLDGCGAQLDMSLFEDLLVEAGKDAVVENCHWGWKPPARPTADWCPWNMFRTSGDVRASYDSVISNLQSTYKYADELLSRPGCWAYPDMLEVGCQHGPGGDNDPGLTAEETRTHFGAWAIVSSPLVLSHDVNNATIMDEVWDVISNKEIIAVNQAWYGHPGTKFHDSGDHVILNSETNFAMVRNDMSEDELASIGPTIAPSHQFLYKPMSTDGSKTAVLLINSGDKDVDLTLDFSTVPGFEGTEGVSVRCLWHHTDYGTFDYTFTHTIASHDAGFFMITKDAA